MNIPPWRYLTSSPVATWLTPSTTSKNEKPLAFYARRYERWQDITYSNGRKNVNKLDAKCLLLIVEKISKNLIFSTRLKADYSLET